MNPEKARRLLLLFKVLHVLFLEVGQHSRLNELPAPINQVLVSRILLRKGGVL